MTDLRKEFDSSFDNLRANFAGFDALSLRVVYGIELANKLQTALWDYIVGNGPKPSLTFETPAYGKYTPVEGVPETDFPRVVQQQESIDRIDGEWETHSDAPHSVVPSHWPSSDESKVRSLADRITNVITKDREAG